MSEMKHAWALALLAVPVALALLAWRRRGKRPAVVIPSSYLFHVGQLSLRSRLGALPLALRLVVLALLALAMTRPRTGERFEDVVTHGVDMVIALDVSGSMKAEDFRPKNRLHVAKDVVRKFIDTRKHDRLGLVVFAGKAYTQCPLTLDYALLKELVDAVNFDSVDEDGTAIGMGIATASNRLRASKAKSRVIVLVTDGINNRGSIDPMTATQAAKALGMRIYTVGVGTSGSVPIPVNSGPGGYIYEQLDLDEPGLRAIAESTGGYYFRAVDAASFAEAMRKIGELETTRIETHEYVTYEEYFTPFLSTALGLLLLEALLSSTWLRRLP